MYALGGLTAFVVLLLIVGALQPANWSVEKSMLIAAAPEKLFPYINSLKRWQEWISWKSSVNKFEGPDEGAGGVQNWTEKGSSGRVELKESRHNQEVVYQLRMENDKYILNGRISLRPEGAVTRVVWSGWGEARSGPVGKLMMLLFKPMIAKDYLKGLNNLKNLVEKA